jgi:D-alanyl-D-alanine carboxypeptidase (penicillin-binding protein 5/6)
MYYVFKHMRKSKKAFILSILLVLVVGGYCIFALTRSMPAAKTKIDSNLFEPTLTNANITWPNGGQSAIGVAGTDILTSNNTQTPEPTASTIKLVTALMALKAKPLTLGEQGPTLTLTQSDVNIYDNYIKEDGSVVPVEAGEQISEYQMLEAMLLPSANNIADSLAIWSYGSLSNYEVAANKFLASEGLASTHVGVDASGFDPTSVSTANNLVRIGEMVMNNPVLAQIVGESSASGIPVVGSVINVDSLLGTKGIVGIKTGNTDQAGGVFVSASKINLENHEVTLVTAYMQAPTLASALTGSLPLIQSGQANYQIFTLLKEGEQVGSYKLPWQKKAVPIDANSNLDAYAWGGGEVDNAVNLSKITYPASTGKSVGQATVTGDASMVKQSVGLSLAGSFSKPSVEWRLLHP